MHRRAAAGLHATTGCWQSPARTTKQRSSTPCCSQLVRRPSSLSSSPRRLDRNRHTCRGHADKPLQGRRQGWHQLRSPPLAATPPARQSAAASCHSDMAREQRSAVHCGCAAFGGACCAEQQAAAAHLRPRLLHVQLDAVQLGRLGPQRGNEALRHLAGIVLACRRPSIRHRGRLKAHERHLAGGGALPGVKHHAAGRWEVRRCVTPLPGTPHLQPSRGRTAGKTKKSPGMLPHAPAALCNCAHPHLRTEHSSCCSASSSASSSSVVAAGRP